MCGVIFLYQTNLQKGDLSARGRESLNILKHRGPDDEGLIVKQPWLIGHRRLSVIDINSSAQPMCDPTGRYSLSFNGEIYNFRELKKQLLPFWSFKTNGDTEVILAGLLTHGELFIKQMEGMWAFILWDAYQKKAILSRDRLGEKPLYYVSDSNKFACASELPALTKLSVDNWVEDPDSIADYFRYGFYLPGYTAYKNVYEVLPGNNLIWEPGKRTQSKAYWSLSCLDRITEKKYIQSELREKLISSIKKRLVSDVEVGAFLSGGIDSSLIVSILNKELNIKPKTFTIGFGSDSYNESDYAWHVADINNTEHHEQKLIDYDPQAIRDLLFNNVGQPFYDSSILPTAIISKFASSHLKVVLSGDGADELFSGYQRYQAKVLMRWFTRLPDVIKNKTELVIRSLPEPMKHHSHSLIKKAHLFMDSVQNNSPYIAPIVFSDKLLLDIAPDLVNRGHSAPGICDELELDDIKYMMASDALIYLPQDILLKVDRASMAYSLETRAPYLDSELIDLAFSVPRVRHRHGLSGKRLLKDTFSHLLPQSIWKRRKQGFSVPVNSWLSGSLGDDLLVMVNELGSTIQATGTKRLLDLHRSNIRDYGHQLWLLYVYLLWRQNS